MLPPIRINASLVKDLRACPRLAYFKHTRLWQPPPAAPLLFGRAFGLATAAWWLGDDEPLAIFAANWSHPRDAKREHTLTSAAVMLDSYVTYWRKWRDAALDTRVEERFQLMLRPSDGDLPALVVDATLDVLARFPDHILAIENKTMGDWQWERGGPSSWDTDPQVIGYYAQVREAYDADAIQFSTSVSRVGTNELYEGTVEPTTMQLDAWRRDATEAALWWARAPTLRNFDNCRAYFRLCDFNPQCVSGFPPEELSIPGGMEQTEPRYK